MIEITRDEPNDDLGLLLSTWCQMEWYKNLSIINGEIFDKKTGRKHKKFDIGNNDICYCGSGKKFKKCCKGLE